MRERASGRGPGAAALGVMLCVVAGAFGVRALYVPGIALLLLAACAQLTVRAAARFTRVEREPQSLTVAEGVSARFTLRVRGGPLLGGGVLRGLPEAQPLQLRALRRGRLELELRPLRRGAHVIGPSTVRFADPLGICSRRIGSARSRVLVLPRVERVEPARLNGLLADARGAGGTQGTEIDGLRPHRPGAPASRIHWPTVARTGELVERRLHSRAQRLPLVVLDARSPASAEALDVAVRAAASLCVALARLGGCRLLLPGAGHAHELGPDLSTWPELHVRLALVSAGAAPAISALEGAGLVLWVHAHADGPGRLPRGAVATRYSVSPDAGRGDAIFWVAGCAVRLVSRRGAGARAA